jgi:hypothetical protein
VTVTPDYSDCQLVKLLVRRKAIYIFREVVAEFERPALLVQTAG